MRLRLLSAAAAGAALCTALALSANPPAHATSVGHPSSRVLQGIHKIQHVIIIMQENRSFDSYFGVYPGADGIPMKNGVPTVCVPDPMSGQCVKPFVDHSDSILGGPHIQKASVADVDGGKMDGFIREAETRCTPGKPCKALDVMGYHVGTDIPNYWAYAQHFVLNDHMFASVNSWSLPAHFFMVSAWSAVCSSSNPMSCTSSAGPRDRKPTDPVPFAWTDLTWLLHKHNISWRYYLDHGALSSTNPGGVPTRWNILPGFTDVKQDGQNGNVQNLTSFFAQAKAGTLPAVSWIAPDPQDSEHPPARVSTGQAYVTRIINAVMLSSDWGSSAIFLNWDDWSGLYDHVVPPKVDSLGYGIRVPALVVSPFARAGFIDPQTLSFDAYVKFIEDDFLGGARLDPATDGRPDSRPDVRENLSQLGDLTSDFNFSQAPLKPLILNPCPANSTLTPAPPPGCNGKVRMPPDPGDM
jgi:phospholipase C